MFLFHIFHEYFVRSVFPSENVYMHWRITKMMVKNDRKPAHVWFFTEHWHPDDNYYHNGCIAHWVKMLFKVLMPQQWKSKPSKYWKKCLTEWIVRDLDEQCAMCSAYIRAIIMCDRNSLYSRRFMKSFHWMQECHQSKAINSKKFKRDVTMAHFPKA